MIKIARARLQQGHRTLPLATGQTPPLPDRFRGRPVIDRAKCEAGCRACTAACPTGALDLAPHPRLDLGRCLFCTDCVQACPHGALAHARDPHLAARRREDLVVDAAHDELPVAEALGKSLRALLGRSLKLRQVSAGGCNACEADINVLGTVGWDLGRFGIQIVAAPRHADGLLVTGPVTENMQLALRKTWEAVPTPRIAIAVGACAISGGPYLGHPEVHNGAAAVIPVDLFIPGCPPHPYTLLDALLRLLGRRGRKQAGKA